MKKIIGYFLLVSTFLLLTACTRAASSPQSGVIQTCKLHLALAVHQGPSAKASFSGLVSFGSGTGSSFERDFVEEDGTSRPISFYFDGPAVHFILDTPQGPIFGTGIMEHSLYTCTDSGGGTLSGPAVGDLGDWRGTWEKEQKVIPRTVTVTPTPRYTDFTECLGTPILLGILLVVILFIQALAKLFKPASTKPRPPRALSRSRPDTATDNPLLVEYQAIYTATDPLFDLSFEIEKPDRYLGECGLTIADVAKLAPQQTTALEIWLFDARSGETVTTNLVSVDGVQHAEIRQALEQKGPVVLAKSGTTFKLSTANLSAQIHVLAVEYVSQTPQPYSIFAKVMLKISVWPA
jgi:hypothetical protein